MNSNKIVCMGEVMLRLTPPSYQRFTQAAMFEAHYGGCEANVAISIATLGGTSEYVSALPDNDIGKACRNDIRRFGVATDNIAIKDGRIGIYYLEKGAAQRPSNVIYDRADSVFAKSCADDYDFDKIFEGASWFHFSGITPALSDNCAEMISIACKKAKEHGCTVSCDLNYRAKLWSCEKAAATMSDILSNVDIFIANENHTEMLFGIKSDKKDGDGETTNEGYTEIAKKLCEKFSLEKAVITIRRTQSAFDNTLRAMIYSDGNSSFSKKYSMHMVDRVGGGDALAAGLIYALQAGMNDERAIQFAVAASCLKHSIEGDYSLTTAKEVEALAFGKGNTEVKR